MTQQVTQPASRLIIHPKGVVSRTIQLGLCHDMARRLGLETRRTHDRTEYEAFLFAQIGRHSLKGASRLERGQVIRALETELACREFAEAVVRAPALNPSEYDDAAFWAVLA